MADINATGHGRLLEDYVALWNGDRSKLEAAAESIVVSDPGVGETVEGRDAFEAYLDDLRTAFPDFHVTIDDVLSDGGTVMAEWTVTGTHEGEFGGIPPTDREMTLNGMDKILIADDEVREHRIYYDVRGLFEQLGVEEG
ncbi:MAG: ester cyclase [Haloferacaceae archaeon]